MKKYIFLLLISLQLFCSPNIAYAQQIKYEYDALGRLVQVEDGINSNRVYEYDAAGNRTSLTRPVVKVLTISPNGGSFNNFQSVTLSTPTTGASIYYTTNNTAPTATSSRYTVPFTLSSSATVRAIAIKYGFIDSPELSTNFSFTAATPTISPNGGTWSTAFNVSLSSATTGASIYYTTDGSAPTVNSTLYTGSFGFTGSRTVRAIAVKSGMSLSAERSATFTFVVTPGVPGNAQMRLINNCVWEATWDAVSGADNYSFTETQGSSYVTSSPVTVPCPAGNPEARKPISVQACKSGVCSAQAVFGQVTPVVSSPGIMPGTGNYSSAQTVSLASATSSASIYYTTNNTAPTTNSTLYTAPFVVNSNTTVRAIATKFGMTNSAESSATISILLPVSAPGISPATGTYSSYQTISLSTATAGATIYYSTNNTTPTVSSSLYSGPFVVSSNTVVRAIAVKTGMTASPETSANYVIALPVSSPTITPGTGTYSAAQTVSISSPTPGATIYYTTNNTTPTSGSSLYSGAFVVSGSTTVRAIAVKSGMSDSAESVANISIMSTVFAPGISPGSGTFTMPQTISLSSATAGALIYFTTNNTAPTAGSTLYSSPFVVSTDTTVRAIAVKSGMNSSPESSATYLIRPVLPSPAISPSGSSFIGSQVVALSASAGASIYYTTDNTTPTASSSLYAAPFTLTASATVRAIAVQSGKTNSSESVASFTLLQPAAAPTVSPAGGSYVGSVQVTLGSSTAGASIYYTTNNTAPTTGSSSYSVPFTLTSSATVRAIAVKSGMASSPESTASFTIQIPPANPTGLQSRMVANCAWNASWNSVAGADIYYVLTNNGMKTSTTASISYSCPAGGGDSYRPVWVQACKSGACSSQVYF